MRSLSTALLLAGLFSSPVLAAGETPLTIHLEAQNNSGETGTAKLTPDGHDKTKVVIDLTGAPANVAQPAHIHMGTCDKLDKAPKWKLTPVKDGKSTTVVPASLKTIIEDGTAINVHKSQEEIQTFVSCGNIVRKK